MFDDIKIKAQEFLIGTVVLIRTLPVPVRIILLAAALAIFPGYVVVRVGSQSLWNSRYRSGQVAARPSFTNPKAPTVGTVTVLQVPDAGYSAYVQLVNENFELSADNIPYTFTFQNAAGETVYSVSGKIFLLPGQRKSIVVPKFNAPEPVVRGSFSLGDIHWQKRFSIPDVALTPIRPDLATPLDIYPYTVEVAVRNDSPYQLKRVDLSLFVYDSTGKPLMVSSRQESTVNPSEVRKFPLVLNGLVMEQVARIEVVPATDVLDNGNLLLTQRGSNGSDLQRPGTGF